MIKEYNPELFLALAAMTEGEDWIVGEYLRVKGRGLSSYNKIFQCLFLRGCSSSLGYAGSYYKHLYTKATVEEIIEFFKIKTIKKKVSKLHIKVI